MEGLRWPGMVFGLFAGIATLIASVFDILLGSPGGAVWAFLLALCVIAVSAMMPSLPGWSAGLFVIFALAFVFAESVAVVLASPLLVIAALLGCVAAIGKRQKRIIRRE